MAKNNRTKRQHYVPRTYLKHFAIQKDDKFFVTYAKPDTLDKSTIQEINTNNIALETDLYTLKGDSLDQAMAVENYYQEVLEKHYNRLYSILTNDNINNITDEDRELIIKTVVTMYYRTTNWVNEHNEFVERVFERVFDMAESLGKDYFIDGEVKVSIKSKNAKELRKEYYNKDKNHFVLTQLGAAIKLSEVRNKTDTIVISQLLDVDCEYITSDNPVICTNYNTQHIIPTDPANTLSLPLDNKHMLHLVMNSGQKDKNSIERLKLTGRYCVSQSYMKNIYQCDNAERFIIGSRTSLEMFLNMRNVISRPVDADDNDLEVRLEKLIQLINR